jgi:uncharacterized protein YfiM (DUF2279 family)
VSGPGILKIHSNFVFRVPSIPILAAGSSYAIHKKPSLSNNKKNNIFTFSDPLAKTNDWMTTRMDKDGSSDLPIPDDLEHME